MFLLQSFGVYLYPAIFIWELWVTAECIEKFIHFAIPSISEIMAIMSAVSNFGREI